MKAWQLFKSKENWCRGRYAQDKNGNGVGSQDSTAVTFCAVGALRKVYKEGTQAYHDKCILLDDYITSKTLYIGTTAWNDDKTQRWSKVKAVLKRLDI